MTITITDIERARRRLDDPSIVRQTPVETNRSLNSVTDAIVHLKMEHLQRTGSFKIRGAYNKLTRTAEEGSTASTVVAASAGNHAQGVALAANTIGFDATVVMPKNAPQAKIDATASYGAAVELHGDSFREAMEYARSLTGQSDIFVPAYDDPLIVAGQGTVGLEIIEQVPEVDTVLVPVGGGGLISGIATAIADRAPDTRVVGVQAEGAATVAQSLKKGKPQYRDDVRTIADGIATGGISPLTYELIDTHVDSVVTVSDAEITEALLYLLERSKQLVEAAGATTVAAMCSSQLDISGETVVPVLSGGNVALRDLQRVLTHGLTDRNQLVQLRVRIVDGPGEMAKISKTIGEYDANIQNVHHERAAKDLAVGEAYLDFRIETTGRDQTKRIVEAIGDDGYEVTVRDDL